MKRYLQILMLSVLLLLVGCEHDGSSTIVIPDGGTELPDIFQNTWHAGIACQDIDEDALFITLKSSTQKSSFVAKGSGSDYDGDLLEFEIAGDYDPDTGILEGDVAFTATSLGYVYRRDRFTVDMDNYTQLDYVDMTNYYMHQEYTGCDCKIRFSKKKFWE